MLLLSAPPLSVEGSTMSLYAHRPMVIHHLVGIRVHWLNGDPLHSTSKLPTSTGTVHKSMTWSRVFILVQLNKCVVMCGSDFLRGHSGDGCLSSPIFKNMKSQGTFVWSELGQGTTGCSGEYCFRSDVR